VTLLLIGSSHAPLDALCAASLQTFRLFQQPARMMDVFWGDLHITHQGRSPKSSDSFYRSFRTD